MASAVDGLEPQLVWKHFAAISRIPRGSKNEEAISAHLAGTARKLGLEVEVDEVLNVVVRKPASPGREKAPMVCLQGHMDMVCEKNRDKVHDFEKDPIEIVRKGNVLMANGTTLGADNGIAVATNLAVMEDTTLEHGPLELLFTIDEESGLTGANNLKPGFVRSRILLNLDSEEEGALYVGCSGGANTLGTWTLAAEAVPARHVPLLVRVKGLKGGHSGLEIDKGRGNSLKILNRVLLALEDAGARVATIEGGNKSNAIPREAEALVFVPAKKLDEAKALVSRHESVFKAELGAVEPGLCVTVEGGRRKGRVLKKALQRRVLAALSALPHGVAKMSADIPELVETSTNVAIVRTGAKKLEIETSQRSSVASELDEIRHTVASIFALAGAEVKREAGYPGWKPNMDSAILKVARSTHHALYGKDPHVKAIHAGLECGIIGEKYPGMDMVSFGPTLEAVHSPDEKIYIDTVGRFYALLVAVLKNVR